MKTLRGYQEEAVEKICVFFDSNMNKAKIYISTGLGKTTIIVSAVQSILKNRVNKENRSIAILTTMRIACEQIKSAFLEQNCSFDIASRICELTEQKILITTYQDVIKNQSGLAQLY